MAVHVMNSVPPLIQVGIRTNRPGSSRGRGAKPLLKTALIDTGASITAIHPGIVTALQPLELGKVELARPGAESLWAPTHDIRIAFEPDPDQARWQITGRWFDAEAIAARPASAGIDVLIGQDILSQIVMSWDGPRWKLLLMY